MQANDLIVVSLATRGVTATILDPAGDTVSAVKSITSPGGRVLTMYTIEPALDASTSGPEGWAMVMAELVPAP